MEHPTPTARASAEDQAPEQGPESPEGAESSEGMEGMEGMAASATLHCLTGCATGEIVALVVATAVGLGALASIPPWPSSSASRCPASRCCAADWRWGSP